MSAALSIGGRASSTERSRRGATVRSRQSRKAVGSPARASSTALRLNAVASPSSSSCAARVDRLIEPRGRPDFRTALSQTVDRGFFYSRCCFLQRNIRHRSTSIGHLDARRRMPSGNGYYVIMAFLLLLHEAPKGEPAQQHDIANGSRTARMGPRKRSAAPIIFVVGARRPKKASIVSGRDLSFTRKKLSEWLLSIVLVVSPAGPGTRRRSAPSRNSVSAIR